MSSYNNGNDFCFVVLRTEEVHTMVQGKKHRVQLVNIRNYWQHFVWDGEWSESSRNWTDELRQQLHVSLDNNDSFWMSFTDFIEHYSSLTLCLCKGWNELRLDGKFIKAVDELGPPSNHFCSRYYYEVVVHKQTRVVFGVHQAGISSYQKVISPFVDIGITIVQKTKEGINIVEQLDTSYER